MEQSVPTPLRRPRSRPRVESALEAAVFASRWLQAPLFLGLIVASALYAYKFVLELAHLFATIQTITEEALLLAVLGLVDVTMVANLIFMVVLGGYSLFVSRIDIDDHEDRPEWLDKTNAATLKIKVAASLLGVSGIHLLKTFIDIEELDPQRIMWRVLIHLAFLTTAVGLSFAERILHPPSH